MFGSKNFSFVKKLIFSVVIFYEERRQRPLKPPRMATFIFRFFFQKEPDFDLMINQMKELPVGGANKKLPKWKKHLTREWGENESKWASK